MNGPGQSGRPLGQQQRTGVGKPKGPQRSTRKTPTLLKNSGSAPSGTHVDQAIQVGVGPGRPEIGQTVSVGPREVAPLPLN